MTTDNSLDFQTRVLHDALRPEDWEGATLPPIYQNTAHCHPDAESLRDAFAGAEGLPIYTRLSNPTNSVLEEKLAALEGGKGAIYMSSGMAAISNTCMALLRAGDEFITGRSLFMSTYLLFTRVFSKYKLRCRLVDSVDLEAMEKAITEQTRFIYLETIGNPCMDIPDIQRTATLAHAYNLPLIVDNTLASPYLCRPIELGADLVIHSTTKYLSGHGNAIGGVVIDSGRFDWAGSGRFPDLIPYVNAKGEQAFLDKIWREHHINFGTTAAPLHAYLTCIGLDTLGLRMERHLENSLAVAEYLTQHPKVEAVNYPGLSDHPNHDTAQKNFQGQGFGAMLTFSLVSEAACFQLIKALKLIFHLANLGDCKTLIIHPGSSQYLSFPEHLKKKLGVVPGLLRLSVGIESAKDICADLDQALATL